MMSDEAAGRLSDALWGIANAITRLGNGSIEESGAIESLATKLSEAIDRLSEDIGVNISEGIRDLYSPGEPDATDTDGKPSDQELHQKALLELQPGACVILNGSGCSATKPRFYKRVGTVTEILHRNHDGPPSIGVLWEGVKNPVAHYWYHLRLIDNA